MIFLPHLQIKVTKMSKIEHKISSGLRKEITALQPQEREKFTSEIKGIFDKYSQDPWSNISVIGESNHGEFLAKTSEYMITGKRDLGNRNAIIWSELRKR
jgi:hypothetical protein